MNAKYVMGSSGDFGIGALVAFGVNNIGISVFILNAFKCRTSSVNRKKKKDNSNGVS